MLTLFLLLVMGDTVTGFTAALAGGLLFSIFMGFISRVVPHQKRIKTVDESGNIRHVWIDIPPRGLFG